ncbi:MAG: hypothetical protein D6754_04980 [Alphaproteobacteria bacterium]|nr:MAG: hypothetical protein D6754_04980 [Alphaproteobacteria bacterium]
MTPDLDERAAAILRANDRGGYTVPTAGLYPYQWNWDSGLAALGFAQFDLDRAWRELETLAEAAWPNGMWPHIVFRADDPDYFPGPSVWDAGGEAAFPSSGVSQPPVAISMARLLYERDPEFGRPRLAALMPKLLAWRDWFRRDRAGHGGAILITHPWESGRDNAPDWDAALANVSAEGVGPYTRRDTAHVDPAMRPTRAEYDRYIALVSWGRAAGWDTGRIAREGPFAVADPATTFILMRADRDLMALAEALGEAEAARRIAADLDRAGDAAAALWSDALGAYVARDERTGRQADCISSAAFLAWYGGMRDPNREGRLMTTLRAVLQAAPRALPSLDPRDPRFDARRYWRGPVWAFINWMVARGLAEAGHHAEAARLRADTRALIEGAGFCEYFDPTDGSGAGGREFSWTAAVWLAWASPAHEEG